MREIKFRGYSEDLDKWVYGDLLQYRVLPIIFDDNCEQHECFHSSIGQYTGLKDKNGNEIYEDDILKTWIGGYEQASPYVVEDMRKLYFELKRDDSYYRIQKTEILGNIYENQIIGGKNEFIW